MPKFIGFAGHKQVGKSTAASLLDGWLRSEGHSVKITFFASPLKEMCINILGLKRELVYGDNNAKEQLTHILWDNLPIEIRIKYGTEFYDYLNEFPKPREGPMTVREVMQIVGTDIFRQMLWKDVWVRNPFITQYEEDFVILDDVRYFNEKKAIEDNNGLVILLLRETGLTDQHISEKELDGVPFRHTVENHGSLQELKSKILNIINERSIL